MEDAAECSLTLLKMVSKRTASNSLQDFGSDIIYHCSAVGVQVQNCFI